MSLSSSTLSAIQKAGAAIFTADAKLKNAVKEYADRVNAAMGSNPYGLGNNTLFENWKTVARLSQTFAGIEEEIKKVFQVASELTTDEQLSVLQVPALAAPTRAVKKGVVRQIDQAAVAASVKTKKRTAKPTPKSTSLAAAAPTNSVAPSLESQNDLSPSDVVLKSKKKTAKPQTSAAKSTPNSIVAATVKTINAVKPIKAAKKIASLSTRSPELAGNPSKLLTHLENLLNANEFTVVSQTTAAKETGIPLGSMTAATKKLLDMGRIVAGPTGSFKLADVQQAVTQ